MFETVELDHRGFISSGAKIISAGWTTLLGTEMHAVYSSAPAAPVIAQIGEGHISGLQALVDKGMSPMEALLAATRNVARAFKVDKDLGTLEEGKLADLVVWDRSPLESSDNYRAIHLVMKDGQVIDRNSLPTQRVLTAPSENAA